MALLFFLTCIIVAAHASGDNAENAELANGDDARPLGNDPLGNDPQPDDGHRHESLKDRLQPIVFPKPELQGSAMKQFMEALRIGDGDDFEQKLKEKNIEEILTYPAGGDADECGTKITLYGNLKDICIQEGLCPNLNLLLQGDYDENNPASKNFKAKLDDKGDIVFIHNGPSQIQDEVKEILKQIQLPIYYDLDGSQGENEKKDIMNIIGSVIVTDITNPHSFIARGVCKPSSTSLMSPKESLIKFDYKDCTFPQIFCMFKDDKGIWYLFPIWYELPHHHHHHLISHDSMLPSYIKHCVAKTFIKHTDLTSYRIEEDILFGILPEKTDIEIK